MADGKNIEIKIAATGGDQAAADIRKVEKAADNLSGSGSGQGLKALNTEANKVTKSGVQMGTGFSNVGFQLQDFAVQVGAGTGALRAFSQQAPQLLSGFGPIGITLGTVSAVALPLAGVMFNLGESAEKAGEKAAEAAEKLEKLTDARAKKAAEQSAQDYTQFKAALDDETLAYKRQNDEIQRTIDLLQAKRRAQAEIDSADAALALAKIDASDAPEEEKIRRRAKVQDGLERKRFEDRKAESGDRVNAAFNRATGATGDATLARSTEEAERQRLAEQQAEAQSLKNRINAADQARAGLPAAEAAAKKASNELSAAKNLGQFGSTANRYSPEQIAALQKKSDQAEAEKNRLALASGGVDANDRRRLEDLQGKDGLGGSNAELKKSIEALAKAAEAREETARKAQGDYGSTREIETAKLGGDFEATKRRLETGRISSGSAAGRVEQAAQREAEKEREQAERKAAADADRGNARVGGFGRQAEGLVPKDAPEKARAAFQKVSDGLQNGDQGGEVERLLSLMEQLAALADKKGNDALVRRIDILEQRIRNK